MGAVIEVKNLTFEYGAMRALDNVSFSIPQGSVTALVGPNGAGKTTLMRAILGLDMPVSGSIMVAGVNALDNPRAVHRLCGYLSDFFGVYDALSVRQNLTYFGWCQGLEPKVIAHRIADLADLLKITEKLDEKAGTLSRGNRQRLGIAIALMNDPQILLLDEPASGMDPEARTRLSYLMNDLRARGKTMIVSSHILNELEDYCTDMLVIRGGKLGDHVVLKEYSKATTARVHVGFAGDARAHLQALSAIDGVADAALDGDGVVFSCAGDSDVQARILRELVGKGLPVTAYHPAAKKLQDAYMALADKEVKK